MIAKKKVFSVIHKQLTEANQRGKENIQIKKKKREREKIGIDGGKGVVSSSCIFGQIRFY